MSFALQEAVLNDDLELLAAVCENCNLEASLPCGVTALGLAVMRNKARIAHALLNAGASCSTSFVVNGNDVLPLAFARGLGFEEVVKVLVEEKKKDGGACNTGVIEQQSHKESPPLQVVDTSYREKIASMRRDSPSLIRKSNSSSSIVRNDDHVLRAELAHKTSLLEKSLKRIEKLEHFTSLLDAERAKTRKLEEELDATLLLAEQKETRVKELQSRVLELESAMQTILSINKK